MIERIKSHLSSTNAPMVLVIPFSLTFIILYAACAPTFQGVTA